MLAVGFSVRAGCSTLFARLSGILARVEETNPVISMLNGTDWFYKRER